MSGKPIEARRKVARDWLRSMGLLDPKLPIAEKDTEALAELLQAQHEQAIEEASAVIDEYIASYPADVFPPPDPPSEHGSTKDSCSAQALRIVLPMVRAEIRRALGDSGE